MATMVIGLYDEIRQAREAAEDLRENGFSLDDMSLVSRHSEQAGEPAEGEDPGPIKKAAESAGEGVVLGGLAGLLMGATMLALPGVGPILAAGPFAVTMGGALAGGIAGSLRGSGVPRREAGLYAEAVKCGGTLLTIATSDENADRAAAIMDRHNPVDLMARSQEWAGWRDEDNRDEFEDNERPLYSPHLSSRARSYPSSQDRDR